jgi:hypothetical protein
MVMVAFFSKTGSFPLANPASVSMFALKDAIFSRECTATGLVQASTQQESELFDNVKTRLNKANSLTG